jgi:hypothetical protein
MFDKIATAVEPFALTMIVLAGANMAGWVSFTNVRMVGLVTVGSGVVLIIKHVAQRLATEK